MHNLGLGPDLIAQMIERDVRAVHRWITHFNEYSNLDDEPRSGHPPVTQTGRSGRGALSQPEELHLFICTPIP
jgi:hypothetical protein